MKDSKKIVHFFRKNIFLSCKRYPLRIVLRKGCYIRGPFEGKKIAVKNRLGAILAKQEEKIRLEAKRERMFSPPRGGRYSGLVLKESEAKLV